jgi:hypothetical protein
VQREHLQEAAKVMNINQGIPSNIDKMQSALVLLREKQMKNKIKIEDLNLQPSAYFHFINSG